VIPNNIRNRAKYRLLKGRIRKLLKADLIKETKIVTGDNASLTIILRNGKEIVYRGKISLPLHKYIFKKEYPDKKE